MLCKLVVAKSLVSFAGYVEVYYGNKKLIIISPKPFSTLAFYAEFKGSLAGECTLSSFWLIVSDYNVRKDAVCREEYETRICYENDMNKVVITIRFCAFV